VPTASGQGDDFVAVSVGTAYRADFWSWNWRGEYRYGQTENKWGMLTGLFGEPRPGLGLSAGLRLFDTDGDNGLHATNADIRLGLAFRPVHGIWVVFDRLEVIYGKDASGLEQLTSWRVINNLNLNYKPNFRTQLAFQYGAKYVHDTVDSDGYSGFTDLIGFETRYDLTRRWDVGLRGSMLHSWSAGQLDYSTGVSVGYNVFDNAWLSLGYNFFGFEDRDFSAAGFTSQGPFVKFRFKVDQQSLQQLSGYRGTEK
jgi:hypothetical protein